MPKVYYYGLQVDNPQVKVLDLETLNVFGNPNNGVFNEKIFEHLTEMRPVLPTD